MSVNFINSEYKSCLIALYHIASSIIFTLFKNIILLKYKSPIPSLTTNTTKKFHLIIYIPRFFKQKMIANKNIDIRNKKANHPQAA